MACKYYSLPSSYNNKLAENEFKQILLRSRKPIVKRTSDFRVSLDDAAEFARVFSHLSGWQRQSNEFYRTSSHSWNYYLYPCNTSLQVLCIMIWLILLNYVDVAF